MRSITDKITGMSTTNAEEARGWFVGATSEIKDSIEYVIAHINDPYLPTDLHEHEAMLGIMVK